MRRQPPPLSPLSVHVANATMRTRRDRRAAELRAATVYTPIMLVIVALVGLAVFAP